MPTFLPVAAGSALPNGRDSSCGTSSGQPTMPANCRTQEISTHSQASSISAGLHLPPIVCPKTWQASHVDRLLRRLQQHRASNSKFILWHPGSAHEFADKTESARADCRKQTEKLHRTAFSRLSVWMILKCSNQLIATTCTEVLSIQASVVLREGVGIKTPN